MVRILQAQAINRMVGGAAVMPWEIDLITDEWLMSFEAMGKEMVETRQGYAELDQRFQQAKAKFERRH